MGKTTLTGLPYAEESMMTMLSCFDTILQRDRWTDRWKDGQTELLHQYCRLQELLKIYATFDTT